MGMTTRITMHKTLTTIMLSSLLLTSFAAFAQPQQQTVNHNINDVVNGQKTHFIFKDGDDESGQFKQRLNSKHLILQNYHLNENDRFIFKTIILMDIAILLCLHLIWEWGFILFLIFFSTDLKVKIIKCWTKKNLILAMHNVLD